MEIQCIFTAKVSAPDIQTAAKGIHKKLDDFFDAVNFANPGNLLTSFQVIEVRPGSQLTIAFPNSLDT